MDPRLTPFNGQTAHVSLRGKVSADRFVEGDWRRVVVPVADLDRRPGGPRDRQLLMGARFLALEARDGLVYGQAGAGGYCGWVQAEALGQGHDVTHVVCAPATHLYSGPKVQAPEVAGLSHGTMLAVTGADGAFAETPAGFVPAMHLRPLEAPEADPVAVARRFLGTPYLWGGNSRAGIDCSGLAQAALLACGISCPGDSDLQERMVGRQLEPQEALLPGDLVFWKGHVALVSGDDMILHATGHFMAVVEEVLSQAIARIAAQGGGEVTSRRRPR